MDAGLLRDAILFCQRQIKSSMKEAMYIMIPDISLIQGFAMGIALPAANGSQGSTTSVNRSRSTAYFHESA
jgi:hypothetical protein